jgi:hypothetical protein
MRIKNKRNRVKELVTEAEKMAWEEFGKFLEGNVKENQKFFYRVIKYMRKEEDKDCPLKFMRDREGRILSRHKEIMERWREYFSEILNSKGGDTESDSDDIEEEGDRDSQEVLEERVVVECNENPPSVQELKEALAKMKLSKSAGFAAIAPETLKYMGPRGEAMLLKVFEHAWKQASIPKDWEVAIIVPIFKNKGDNRDCKNHHGISLLCVAGKLYSRILEGRLRQQVENHLEEVQCGFRPNRGMQDAIFSIRQLAEKGIEYGKQIQLCFVDIEKAFNHVRRFIISEVLKKKNVPAAFIDHIRSLYTHCRNFVRTGNASCNYFWTDAGVCQGDILSLLLFMLVMDEALKECSNMKRYKVGNVRLQPVVINVLGYADDLVLFADSAQKL